MQFYDKGDTNPDSEHVLSNNAFGDVFVAKIDKEGKWQWSAKIGGGRSDQGAGISAVPDGVYVIGNFDSSTLQFFDNDNIPDTTHNLANVDTNGFTSDVFIAKIDEEGVWQWSAKIGGVSFDQGLGISAGQDGVYVTGYFLSDPLQFYDAGDTNPNSVHVLSTEGSADAFVAKIDEDGEWEWSAKIGGGGTDQGTGISAGQNGVYVTGFFSSDTNNPMQFYNAGDTNPNSVHVLSTEGNFDVFIAKIRDCK